MTKTNNSNRTLLIFIFLIFALSGFSGLIYESIWSRYLKLFLGNASYAQMLVLIIFMGGMAIGSALAAKVSHKLKNLILWYGIAEGLIGLFGISFHWIFVNTNALAFEVIFPNIDGQFTITSIKFLLAAIIILPQSILLGATFPLITAGLIKKYPDQTGSKISTLYFLNSLGAAIGVLFNAFYLVPSVGLPGSTLTAGLLNIFIAITIYILSKNEASPPNIKTLPLRESSTVKLFLAIALITGMASFIYEIAWIRLLSLVLGASTDAFEIMLSAFILGLAIGAYVIKNKVDKLKNPIITLAKLQIAMGIFAALTIPLYNYTFEILSFVKLVLQPTDAGYHLYNIASFLISSMIMLPATICAGTTLPLITYILLKKYKAESAIGTVYSFNTLGAIIGILFAVQLILPALGLKFLVLIGAVLDVSLGLILLIRYLETKKRVFAVQALISVAVLIFVSFTQLNLVKMSSGVFRHGRIVVNELNKVLYHADGKVSTVDIIGNDKKRFISNNGKPDAGISFNIGDEKHFTGDEPTMRLLGVLPYLYNENVKTAANIGFGSGLTAETLLANTELVRLDTIEIEEKVIEAGKYFYPKVSNVYTDSRSHIIIDDAKTYFVSNNKQYDAIISEPPNPWVSGVASLFTKEFYSLTKKYLNEDGVFVQWIHLYEFNPSLFATIYNAIRSEFNHITLYHLSTADVAIVATRKEKSLNTDSVLMQKGILKALDSVTISSKNDLVARVIADGDLLDHYIENFAAGQNSDYFPLLDNGATKARFKNENANIIFQLQHARILKRMLRKDYPFDKKLEKLTVNGNFAEAVYYNNTLDFFNYLSAFLESKPIEITNVEESKLAFTMKNIIELCDDGYGSKKIPTYLSAELSSILAIHFSLAPLEQLKKTTDIIFKNCNSNLDQNTMFFIRAIDYWLNADYKSLFDLSKKYLTDKEFLTYGVDAIILKMFLASGFALNLKPSLDMVDKKIRFDLTKDVELSTLYGIHEREPDKS